LNLRNKKGDEEEKKAATANIRIEKERRRHPSMEKRREAPALGEKKLWSGSEAALTNRKRKKNSKNSF